MMEFKSIAKDGYPPKCDGLDVSRHVLVNFNNGWIVAYYDFKFKTWVDAHAITMIYVTGVTHWLLPELTDLDEIMNRSPR